VRGRGATRSACGRAEPGGGRRRGVRAGGVAARRQGTKTPRAGRAGRRSPEKGRDAGRLDGTWSSRWRTGGALDEADVVEAKTAGQRVHLLVRQGQWTYLLVLVREGNRLRGRYVETGTLASRPVRRVVVDDRRIDGYYGSRPRARRALGLRR